LFYLFDSRQGEGGEVEGLTGRAVCGYFYTLGEGTVVFRE